MSNEEIKSRMIDISHSHVPFTNLPQIPVLEKNCVLKHNVPKVQDLLFQKLTCKTSKPYNTAKLKLFDYYLDVGSIIEMKNELNLLKFVTL